MEVEVEVHASENKEEGGRGNCIVKSTIVRNDGLQSLQFLLVVQGMSFAA